MVLSQGVFVMDEIFSHYLSTVQKEATILPGFVKNLNRIWEAYLGDVEHRIVKNGETILLDKAQPFHLFYIRTGKISVNVLSRSGDDITTFYVGNGCLCNEAFLFTKFETITENPFVTLQNCDIYFLTEEIFMKKLSSEKILMMNVIFGQASKILGYNKLNIILGKKNPYQKVASFLYDCYINFGNNEIYINLGKLQIAKLLKIHQVNMSKIIKNMKNEGVISYFDKNTVVIKDPELLYYIADPI